MSVFFLKFVNKGGKSRDHHLSDTALFSLCLPGSHLEARAEVEP